VHSQYQCTLADLPLAHIPVQIHLHVQRFFCDTATCIRTTFREPVPALARRSAHRTTRLTTEQQYLGLELGGEPGARLARRQGMSVSADTLLRLTRRESAKATSTVRSLSTSTPIARLTSSRNALSMSSSSGSKRILASR
jgi:hypothetical protein